ncbi:hypothetical protein HELRODRAFT_166410 [Helobdella robusta]|uniref:Uncharacterized protein n=1 Tax=Helobdella robusta TaxID=6412 RepID=T1EY38_HELRO|nr:hypothetical protein HELRODRAFT_166410 [Helobdella robusta]ESN90706.1 hypothetical protein HELRODRAFT_166410 [Helobdella robusta]
MEADFDFSSSNTAKISSFFKKPQFKLSHSEFDSIGTDFQISSSVAKSKKAIDAETIRSYAAKAAPAVLDSPYKKSYYLNLRKELTAESPKDSKEISVAKDQQPFNPEKFEIGEKLKKEELVDYSKKFTSRCVLPPSLRTADVDYAAKSNFPATRPLSSQGLRESPSASWMNRKGDDDYSNLLDYENDVGCTYKTSESSMMNSTWKNLDSGEKSFVSAKPLVSSSVAAGPNVGLTSSVATPTIASTVSALKYKSKMMNFENDDDTYDMIKNSPSYKEWTETRFNTDSMSSKSEDWY